MRNDKVKNEEGNQSMKEFEGMHEKERGVAEARRGDEEERMREKKR